LEAMLKIPGFVWFLSESGDNINETRAVMKGSREDANFGDFFRFRLTMVLFHYRAY
jgi:hypothetical protein